MQTRATTGDTPGKRLKIGLIGAVDTPRWSHPGQRRKPRIINSTSHMPSHPSPQTGLLIRPSLADDIPAFTAIYAHAVQTGTGSFELEAPDATEMARRRDDVLS